MAVLCHNFTLFGGRSVAVPGLTYYNLILFEIEVDILVMF